MTERLDLVIKNGTLVLGGGSYRMAVGIQDGKVAVLGAKNFCPRPKRKLTPPACMCCRGSSIAKRIPGVTFPSNTT
jgi:hypothetical protein